MTPEELKAMIYAVRKRAEEQVVQLRKQYIASICPYQRGDIVYSDRYGDRIYIKIDSVSYSTLNNDVPTPVLSGFRLKPKTLQPYTKSDMKFFTFVELHHVHLHSKAETPKSPSL